MSDRPDLSETIAVQIEHYVPETLSTQYANHFLVQLTEEGCYLSIFEVTPPILLGTPDQVRERAGKVNAIHARCIARFLVSPERMAELADTVKNTLEKFRSLRASGSAEVKENARTE